MLEIGIGLLLAAGAGVVFLFFRLSAEKKKSATTAEQVRAFRIGKKKEAARREILRESTGDGDAWRRRMRRRLREAKRNQH